MPYIFGACPPLYKAYNNFFNALTHVQGIDNKPEHVLRMIAKTMSPIQVQRWKLRIFTQLPKYVLWPGIITFGVINVGLFATTAAPFAHNYHLKKSHEDRAARHLEYLENNPKYLNALLNGYKYMVPQEN